MTVLAAGTLAAQSDPDQVRKILEQPLLTPDVVAVEGRQYLRAKAQTPRVPANRAAWNEEARRIST